MPEKWFTDVKRGRTNTNDVERSGHPKEVLTPACISFIVHKNWSMSKLFLKWVPHGIKNNNVAV